MAIRFSTGAVQAGLESGGKNFYDLFNNGWIDIFDGAQPANADAVETGTKLVRISSTCGTAVEDGVKFGTAANGFLPIGTPAWQGQVKVAGVAGWGRFYASSGTGGLAGTSSTAVRFDFSIGVSGANCNLSHTNLALSSILTITEINVIQPKE